MNDSDPKILDRSDYKEDLQTREKPYDPKQSFTHKSENIDVDSLRRSTLKCNEANPKISDLNFDKIEDKYQASMSWKINLSHSFSDKKGGMALNHQFFFIGSNLLDYS